MGKFFKMEKTSGIVSMLRRLGILNRRSSFQHDPNTFLSYNVRKEQLGQKFRKGDKLRKRKKKK